MEGSHMGTCETRDFELRCLVLIIDWEVEVIGYFFLPIIG